MSRNTAWPGMIRKALSKMNLSQRELADRLDVSQQTVSATVRTIFSIQWRVA